MFCHIVMLVGCSKVDSDVIIYDGQQILAARTTILPFKQQPKLTRENDAIRFEFATKWSLEDGAIKTQDGNQVRLVVRVFDKNGNQYLPITYGEVFGQKHYFAANFQSFKQGTQLDKIEVVSSGDILCKQILWHSYDPF